MKRVKTFSIDRIPLENDIGKINYMPTDGEVKVFATASLLCKKLAYILIQLFNFTLTIALQKGF